MNTLSAISKSLLVLLLFVVSFTYGADRRWPVKGEIDLSDNFCSFRPGHFHGGIDIRTGGKDGRKIYSPVDGYVWRIKYSYIGYGKGLYLIDNQGFIYVFGHLSRLSKKLEKFVKPMQYKEKKYYFDIFLKADSIPVKRGELIAFSGQSGYGGPHIHFEIRNPNNMPLNPLTNNFNLDDKISPEFLSVGLVYRDMTSLFPNGKRRLIQKPKYSKMEQRYIIKTPVVIRGSFGIVIKASDRIRENGPRLNIYRARLFIDDYLYYEVQYENYDYNQTSMVDLSYDYQLVSDKKEYWHLLFEPPGKEFGGSHSEYIDGGIFTIRSRLSYGLHEARVEIYDAVGNMSQLNFNFVILPESNLFAAEWQSDSVLYLIGQSENMYFDINNVSIYGASGRRGWWQINPERMELIGTGDYQITLPTGDKKPKALKIGVEGESGWSIVDRYIALTKQKKRKYRFNHQLIDGGVLFEIQSPVKYSPAPTIAIQYEDGYVKNIESAAIKADKFAAFYSNDQIRSKIIRFDIYDDQTDLVIVSKEVEIFLAGTDIGEKTYTNSAGFSLTYDPEDFYTPTLIEAFYEKKPPQKSGNVIGRVYTVRPTTVPLAGSIEISFEVVKEINKSKISIYRLNKKKIWKWIDSQISSNRITAKSGKTGTFAVLKDTKAPRVKKIYPSKGKTIKSAHPGIGCLITDDLSGIKDDGNITVLLDGRWLIPEYDPETEGLKTYPDRPLANGRHELVINVTDRAGNSRTVYSHFFVKGR
jgi:hypothetical protein